MQKITGNIKVGGGGGGGETIEDSPAFRVQGERQKQVVWTISPRYVEFVEKVENGTIEKLPILSFG